jgi:hypothetical protein
MLTSAWPFALSIATIKEEIVKGSAEEKKLRAEQ